MSVRSFFDTSVKDYADDGRAPAIGSYDSLFPLPNSALHALIRAAMVDGSGRGHLYNPSRSA